MVIRKRDIGDGNKPLPPGKQSEDSHTSMRDHQGSRIQFLVNAGLEPEELTRGR